MESVKYHPKTGPGFKINLLANIMVHSNSIINGNQKCSMPKASTVRSDVLHLGYGYCNNYCNMLKNVPLLTWPLWRFTQISAMHLLIIYLFDIWHQSAYRWLLMFKWICKYLINMVVIEHSSAFIHPKISLWKPKPALFGCSEGWLRFFQKILEE